MRITKTDFRGRPTYEVAKSQIEGLEPGAPWYLRPRLLAGKGSYAWVLPAGAEEYVEVVLEELEDTDFTAQAWSGGKASVLAAMARREIEDRLRDPDSWLSEQIQAVRENKLAA